MEVISSFITAVAMPQDTEFGELNAELASLKRQLSAFQATGRAEPTAKAVVTGEPDPDHFLHHSLGYNGTTDVLAILHENAYLHPPSWEMIWPAARGNERCWPYKKSPILHYQPLFRTKILD